MHKNRVKQNRTIGSGITLMQMRITVGNMMKCITWKALHKNILSTLC